MLYVGSNRSSNPFGGLGCLLIGGLLLVGFFYFAKWLYIKLWYAVPVFVILALAINHRVVLGSLMAVWRTFARNPIYGLLSAAVGALMLPFISVGWVLGALGANRITKMQQEFGQKWGFGAFDPANINSSKDTEYVEFEEIETKKNDDNK
jgi:hypothetical protein